MQSQTSSYIVSQRALLITDEYDNNGYVIKELKKKK